MNLPVRLSVALVVATAATCVVPGVGLVAASVLPHVAIVALVMTVGAASGWLTERRAAAVLGDGLWLPFNQVVGVAWLLLPSVAWTPVGLLDGCGPWTVAAVYLVAYDTLGAVTHRLFHALPVLWPIHEVHHSHTVYQPTLAARVHAAEPVRTIAAAAFLGWLLGGDTSAMWSIAVILPLWGYTVHMPVRIPLGPLAWVLVTPQYHAIHHSADPRHHDRNFGNIFTFGDLLMGTACFDFDAVLEYGTGTRPAWEADEPTVGSALRAWWGALWHPVRAWFGMKSPQCPAGEVRNVRG